MTADLKNIQKICEQHHVRMIDFMMIDLDGRWRHLTMPVERFDENTMTNGIGFDGSNYNYATVENSDMVFIPDLNTAYLDSFAAVPTLAMLGDAYIIGDQSNARFDQYPRNVAYHAEQYLKNSGVADEMRIGPEFEFHVLDHVSYSVQPNLSAFEIDAAQAEWNTHAKDDNLGYKIPSTEGYHAAPPQDVLSDFRSKVTLLMEKQNIPVKYHHHEVGGSGQLEIEVEFGGLREMADKTMMTKYIVKNAAIAEGKTATFMPKPIYGEAGNGMHVHMHMFKDGHPVFYDKNGYSGLSDTALYFIGGMLKHARSLCAFTNPSTNSYKRLVPGFEAPVTIGYATSNRSAVIRIPAYAKAPTDKRFELRSPDGTCNPYYAFAAILMAGMDGIENEIDPEKAGFGPYDCNLYQLSKEERKHVSYLPESLSAALQALTNDHKYLTKDGVFSQDLISRWIAHQKEKVAQTNSMPTPMEYKLYYDL